MIVLVSLLFKLGFIQPNKELFSEAYATAANAVVVLTKGYDSLEEYQLLVRRNQAIYANFYSMLPEDADIEVVIFHEGNVLPEHQAHIQASTPQMPLVFRTISFLQPTTEQSNAFCYSTELSEQFSLGYKNMCRFWSVGIFEHMAKYEYIIRIDEDCILEKLDPDVLTRYQANGVKFASPAWIGEDTFDVTIGMHQFFRTYKMDVPREVANPYTNFMIVNVPYFAAHEEIQKCLADIDRTNCIFVNRWGDMPLWGYLLAVFVEDNAILLEDKNIVYYHGSHDAKINGD
jgi:hypothetical protein